MNQIEKAHTAEDKKINERFQTDLDQAKSKVADKQRLYDEAVKLFTAAQVALAKQEAHKSTAEGALAQAKKEYEVTVEKASQDQKLDKASNKANKEESLTLIRNQRNLVTTIKSLLAGLNTGNAVPLTNPVADADKGAGKKDFK